MASPDSNQHPSSGLSTQANITKLDEDRPSEQEGCASTTQIQVATSFTQHNGGRGQQCPGGIIDNIPVVAVAVLHHVT
jgi:hypothetical protein